MGRRYIEEAAGRVDLVRLAAQRKLWATVVREAQEAVEMFLKGALRNATHGARPGSWSTWQHNANAS